MSWTQKVNIYNIEEFYADLDKLQWEVEDFEIPANMDDEMKSEFMNFLI